jgi:hypothetical protein
MQRAHALAAVTVTVALLTGCVANDARSRLHQLVIDGEPDAVLAAGATILQREFGRVALDKDAHRITTAPFIYTTASRSGTASDLYGGRTTMRRTALFEVSRRNEQTLARIRIDVERQDTQRRRVVHPQGHRISDAPGHDTPITQDAATTEKQNTVWTEVRRDTRLERTLLRELQDLFARRSAAEENVEPSTPPAE